MNGRVSDLGARVSIFLIICFAHPSRTQKKVEVAMRWLCGRHTLAVTCEPGGSNVRIRRSEAGAESMRRL